MLIGPGFAPFRAAAKILAVSRGPPASDSSLAAAGAGFAAAGFAAAALAAGAAFAAGFSAAGLAAGAAPPSFARAAAKISATLGRPPPAALAGAFGAAGFTGSAGAVESATLGALSATGGSAGALGFAAAASPAAPSPADLPRAIANMSAVESFFFSAIAGLSPIETRHAIGQRYTTTAAIA